MPIPKLLITVGLIGAQVALGMLRKIEGPRLDSLEVTTAEYGTPLEDFYGQRRLEGRPVIWAEKLKEVKKTSKTKGGKYAEYKYYGTWAVAICGHEIEAVSKIWFDKHPVYQSDAKGPIANLFHLGGAPGDLDPIKVTRDSIKIYLGDQTQPNPRMEAWFEDQADFGVGMCSALKGIAYIVFKDIPLEKFGNRIPQVDVEAITLMTDAFLFDVRSAGGLTLGNAQFSPDYMQFTIATGGIAEVWDAPTRQRISRFSTNAGAFAVTEGGGFYGLDGFSIFQDLIYVTPGGSESIAVPNSAFPAIMGNIFYEGGHVLLTTAAGGGDAYVASPTGPATGTITTIGVGFNATFYFTDANGDVIAMGFDGSDIHFHNLITQAGFTVPSSGSGDAYAMVNPDGNWFVGHPASGDVLLIDPNTGSILGTATGLPLPSEYPWRNARVGAPSIWFEMTEVDTVTMTVIRTIDGDDYTAVGGVGTALYDPVNHALVVSPSGLGNSYYWLYLDRVGSPGVTLGSIVEAEGMKAGLTIDGSDLDQTVEGWSVAQGPVKDRISPLLDLHDSVLRPHDFAVQGLKRHSTSAGIIDLSDFVREGDGPPYEIEEVQDTDLPQRIETKFADNTKSQQINNVVSIRQTISTDSVRVQPIDLSTYADTPNGAQQKADRFLRNQWNRRAIVKNSLTAQLLAAEVGDVYDLELGGVQWTVELERQTLLATSPAFSCEWRRTYPSLLGSADGPILGGRDDEEVFVPGPSKTFALDIPLVTDADNSANPLVYYGIGGYGLSFPGASFFVGLDPAQDFADIGSVTSTAMATWGYATDALTTANPNLWDRGNTVNVVTYGDSLTTGLTEDDIYNNPLRNLAVLRNPSTGEAELFNFTTATLEMDGSYTLSGLLRGRRGTEWAVDGHGVGDEFILVEDLFNVAFGLSDVGNHLFFKGQVFGRDPDTAPVINVTYSGATLKPYAPVIWHVTKDGTSGDITIELRSRTRIGGAWNGSTIPTGETIESYEFDVYDTGTFKRTLTSSTKFFTYTAADQTADFGSEIEAVDLEGFAYQLSASVGRGFARAA